jgi:hypothetical protein
MLRVIEKIDFETVSPLAPVDATLGFAPALWTNAAPGYSSAGASLIPGVAGLPPANLPIG